MPLIKSKSKKAFEHNVEAEMEAHPGKDNRAQNLAIAYSVKRKAAKKKMAEGGQVNESAASERRPMPEEHDKDAAMVSRNSGNKAPHEDSMTSRPDIRQSTKGMKTTAIKHPRMVPTSAYTARLRSEEDDLQMSAKPGPYGSQPPRHDDEEGADRQGPALHDMSDEHSTRRKPYAKGGEVEASDYSARPNKYEDDITDLHPSEDEGYESAMSHNEMHESQTSGNPDMEREHSNGRKPYAKGGMASEEMDETSVIPDKGFGKIIMVEADGGLIDTEEDMEHHASIAAAIMAKRAAKKALESGSEDEDHAVMMADGGILSHDSIYSDDSDQADLSRNADEDANEEDQLSFNALRKENYSESEGLRQLDSPTDSNEHGDSREDDEENKHDMISAIRSKMKKRSPITR